jgi:hypothetical protein
MLARLCQYLPQDRAGMSWRLFDEFNNEIINRDCQSSVVDLEIKVAS